MDARIEGVTAAGGNAWIIGDDDEVIVIDPGTDAGAVLDAVGEREILAVICTHGHAAHIGAAVEVAERDEAPVALHSSDRVSWRMVHPDADPEIEVEDGGSFEVADVRLEVLYAPGHSPGSICLYCEELDAVFAGDVLSADGPVPHEKDFPDFPRQLSSIGERLLTLPPVTRILPGHGQELTVSVADKTFDSWATAGAAGLLAAGESAGPSGIPGLAAD
jgi:glyoxylase-like metal-dependent hydrolase (beta-lactamase superfamily II)